MSSPQIILSAITVEELRGLIGEAVRAELQSQTSIAKPPDELLSRAEAARMLRVSLPTLRALTERGLPMHRAGYRVLYSRNDIMDFLTRKKEHNEKNYL